MELRCCVLLGAPFIVFEEPPSHHRHCLPKSGRTALLSIYSPVSPLCLPCASCPVPCPSHPIPSLIPLSLSPRSFAIVHLPRLRSPPSCHRFDYPLANPLVPGVPHLLTEQVLTSVPSERHRVGNFTTGRTIFAAKSVTSSLVLPSRHQPKNPYVSGVPFC